MTRASLLMATILATPALAQDVRDHHAPDDIVVTSALPRSRTDLLSSVDVLQGDELRAQLRTSIGETLQRTPGVSSSYFGPVASRPVLRGLQGERVRVLANGIGAIDVSNTSADHAPAVNPLLAERIEVLRGPQSLAYGASAIGGVVNVIDNRIPGRVDDAIHLGASLTYATAAQERLASGVVDVPLGDGFALHLDGSYAKSDDLRIPGFVLSPAARATALATSLLPAGPDFDPALYADNAALRGRLPNSAARSWQAGAGFGYVGDGGALGVSYARLDSRYGLPVRLAILPGQEQEAAQLAMKQDRVELRGEIKPASGAFSAITLRAAFADYNHAEIEDTGEVGTTFCNQGLEARFQLTQRAQGGWRGASGVQLAIRDFDVVGEEAFLPASRSEQLGIFTLQEFDIGAVKIEIGGRYERNVVSAHPRPDQPQFSNARRAFDSWSASGGVSFALADAWRLGVNVSRVERAPSAEELFANGPHKGTAAFEVGNADLAKERATSVEAHLRGRSGPFQLEVSGYHAWFAGFIYDNLTGAVEDGLPVYAYRQADARMWGVEGRAEATLATLGQAELSADVLADYTRVSIVDRGPAPRIPPLRIAGGLSLTHHAASFRAEVEHTTAQRRIAIFETATPAFTMVNLEASVKPFGERQPLTLMATVHNLFDVEGRRHASVLKDFAPLPGRDVRVTARVNF